MPNDSVFVTSCPVPYNMAPHSTCMYSALLTGTPVYSSTRFCTAITVGSLRQPPRHHEVDEVRAAWTPSPACERVQGVPLLEPTFNRVSASSCDIKSSSTITQGPSVVAGEDSTRAPGRAASDSNMRSPEPGVAAGFDPGNRRHLGTGFKPQATHVHAHCSRMLGMV
eukprot:scaffold222068_cov35-Tisochrysis_lutea.AAC.2